MARVVFITDPRFPFERTLDVVRIAAHALPRGELAVQLRDKDAASRAPAAFLEAARALRTVTREVGALFVVNGPPEIAAASLADGLHIPSSKSVSSISPGGDASRRGEDLAAAVAAARAMLGASAFVTTVAHDDDEDVRRASEAGATGVLVSPIWTTPDKGTARGTLALTNARSTLDAMRRAPSLRVYALGGVTHENAAECLRAGADGVAAIRALYDHPARPWALGVAVGRGGC